MNFNQQPTLSYKVDKSFKNFRDFNVMMSYLSWIGKAVTCWCHTHDKPDITVTEVEVLDKQTS